MHLEHSGFCCCFPTVVASSLSLCLLALQSYHFSRLLTSEGGKICKSQRSFDKQRRKGPNNKGCVLICFTSYLAITWVQWEPPVKAGSKWLFFLLFPLLCPGSTCVSVGLHPLLGLWVQHWQATTVGVYLSISSFLAELRHTTAPVQRSPSPSFSVPLSGLWYFKPCCQNYLQMWYETWKSNTSADCRYAVV